MKLHSAKNYDTDKLNNRRYLKQYDRHFAFKKNEPVKLIELGVNTGGSLRLWDDYFQNTTIVGLDYKNINNDDFPENISIYKGYQQDISLLDRMANDTAPEGYDFIIDDCSHIGELTSISFWHLFINHLKPGGIYVIEDWGTGYWNIYPDGHEFDHRNNLRINNPKQSIINKMFNRVVKLGFFNKFFSTRLSKKRFRNHDYGMVGFVKQLIDECAIEDSTKLKYGTGAFRKSEIESIHISFGQVFIYKSKNVL